MTRKIGTLALGVVLMAGGATAMAQDSHQPAGVSARIGLFFPTDAAPRRVADNWFAFGVEYNLSTRVNPLHADRMTISLDHVSRGDYRSVPLLVNLYRHHGQMYFGAGVGVAFSRYPRGLDVDDRARLGYQFTVGHEFGNAGSYPIFLEGRFLGNERAELNGFGIFAGVRF
jgi:hypothetical protein